MCEEIVNATNFSVEISSNLITKVAQLSINKGELVCLVGPNGSGKTSFMQCCAGIIPHITGGTVTGSLRVLGADLNNNSTSALRGKVIYIPNAIDMFFVCISPYDEILYTLAGSQHRDDLSELKQRAQELVNEFEINDLLGKEFAELSYGQKAKCAVACAIASDPELILMDEVMSSLDDDTRIQIQAFIDRFVNQGGTCIAADHDFKWNNAREVVFKDLEQTESPTEDDAIELERWTHKDGLLIGISGKNGSGKTTILRHLAGFLPESAFDGDHKVKLSEVRGLIPIRENAISYMPQESHYMFRNFRLIDDIEAVTSNPNLILSELELDKLSLKTTSELSYGQQKKAALALSLGTESNLFLLDEPTRSLDSNSKKQIIEYILKFCYQNNVVVICATHDQELLDVCDSRIELKTKSKSDLSVSIK